ncbi:TetR/AcrR family transcriptional regulator [Limibacillus halophilus]
MTKPSAGAQERDRRTGWKQNPEAVQANILRVARKVFAKNGLSGARVDEIASLTATSKRMIYYYFGDKEGLYRKALEEAYREVRRKEEQLNLEGLDPKEALERLVEFTFDHHHANPDFIRLVMIENIHHGKYLAASDLIRDLNRGAITQLDQIIRRGRAQGLFRDDADPLVVHWQISALSFFNVSNEATFSLIFGEKLSTAAGQKRVRQWAVTAVMNAVLAEPIA